MGNLLLRRAVWFVPRIWFRWSAVKLSNETFSRMGHFVDNCHQSRQKILARSAEKKKKLTFWGPGHPPPRGPLGRVGLESPIAVVQGDTLPAKQWTGMRSNAKIILVLKKSANSTQR